MQLFYKANFELEKILDEIDSKHCVRVLRKNKGDEINVTDGEGNLFKCTIAEANPKKAKLNILETIRAFEKPSRYVHLAIAPTKNLDRMEYFVEKAVEIGVSEISFIQAKNSERKVLKLDRLHRIAISGMKQSLKAYLPKLNELKSLRTFLEDVDAAQMNLIAHLNEKSVAISKKKIGTSVCIIIGPEGDFDQNEINMAEEKGFEMVSMGKSRLRTETAGVVAVTLLNIL
jgi:16S rRNA (uracil1498-N3)-methyltransferase